MIITRTPLRISLVGGGTDMPSFYHQGFGAVVSFTIDKFIYVMLNRKFDGLTRLSYSALEEVKNPIDLKHDLIRAALIQHGAPGMDIGTMSDIPGEGSGLGSSSAVLVGVLLGLLKAMKSPLDTKPPLLAEIAYRLEKDICRHSVGKQDHYAATHGGLNYFQFNADETAWGERIDMQEMHENKLAASLLLFWTGRTRKANEILDSQSERLKFDPRIQRVATKMRDLAIGLSGELKKGRIDTVGEMLDENWYLKKKLAHGITDMEIDSIYQRAKAAGAIGGKLCGAGGGGFFLFAVKEFTSGDVERAVGLRRVPFKICKEGSKIIFNDETR